MWSSRPTLGHAIDLVASGYIGALLLRAAGWDVFPLVRRYDMFAYPLTRGGMRTLVLFHHANGETTVVAAAHILPLEPARCTSILRLALNKGDDEVRRIAQVSLDAQRRGWIPFDQVRGPANRLRCDDVVAACVHVLAPKDVKLTLTVDHSACRVTL